MGITRAHFLRVAVLAGFAGSGAVAAVPPMADSAPAGKRYIYKESAGVPQALEVYLPPQAVSQRRPVPGLLLFHGGGWSRGSLDQFRHACAYFAGRGLVAATADYRMHTAEERAKLPADGSYKRACITDAKSAIRWMKRHAAEFGLDPRRLIVGGGSAGGHIAVLATLNSALDDPAEPPGVDTSVAAYVLFNPAFAPKDADAAVNVLAHLRADLAPAIAFFGTEDRWKPGWDQVREKLRAFGHTGAELWVARGGNHGFYLEPPWREATLAAADRFLVRQGFLQGEPPLAAAVAPAQLEPSP